MKLLRARYAAAATGAYFAIVVYLAWDTARQTTALWFDPSMSQTVYQTSMVAGILLIAGLIVVASMHPRLAAVPRSGGRVARWRARRAASPDGQAPTISEEPGTDEGDAGWTRVERVLAGLIDVGAARTARSATTPDPRKTPARMRDGLPSDGSSSGGTGNARTVETLSKGGLVAYTEEEGTARPLSECVGDIQALLEHARRAGMSGHEVWQLVGEPMSGPDTDLAQRVRVAEHVKETLEAAIVRRIREQVEDVLAEVQTLNAAAERARNAELAAAEAIALLDMGNYRGATDRVERASLMFTTRNAAEGAPARGPGRSSWVVLVGPAIGALAYVAASSMLLPGINGFLIYHYQLNTTVILALSYGWVGLLIYALVSVYMTLSSAPHEARGRSTQRS